MGASRLAPPSDCRSARRASALLDPPRPFTRLRLLSSAPLHSYRRASARRPRTTKRPSGRLHVANGRTSGYCDHQLRPERGAGASRLVTGGSQCRGGPASCEVTAASRGQTQPPWPADHGATQRGQLAMTFRPRGKQPWAQLGRAAGQAGDKQVRETRGGPAATPLTLLRLSLPCSHLRCFDLDVRFIFAQQVLDTMPLVHLKLYNPLLCMLFEQPAGQKFSLWASSFQYEEPHQHMM
ncbi:uncharacterized protein LOC120692222 isoform X2 [Panicum virgatum]|uniref:Uncharacterized protein n=1 Tax=Panicum virgatum TaxID=38727 RepID=A0A8T0MGS6_PANVG|nr:uncharacterized protein LOC120692222 isoform X2 [Panicum virgatum]KAG2536530.1 hypothetical protein PVAP13_9NG195300 [Panicum virgatum]